MFNLEAFNHIHNTYIFQFSDLIDLEASTTSLQADFFVVGIEELTQSR